MNILETIVNTQDGAAVRQLGSQFGLGQDQAAGALAALMPALAAGVQRNISSEGGLESLLGALTTGTHQQYINNPAQLGSATAVADGNGILGHILGSKEVSREVATRAAAQTGVSADVLKKMLPLAATLMMGAFAKQSASARAGGPSIGGAPLAAGGGIASMLTPLLDRNRDGSMVDDVTSMIGRFMKR
jgi:hypothetical protein